MKPCRKVGTHRLYGCNDAMVNEHLKIKCARVLEHILLRMNRTDRIVTLAVSTFPTLLIIPLILMRLTGAMFITFLN